MLADEVSQIVQARYGKFAEAAGATQTSCCSKPAPSACCALGQGLYGESELSSVPELARTLSRGCGNPTGFANLQPGEVVVDFGCGGGIDVILAARKVGERGKVIGVDLTAQMIERAGEVVVQAGLQDQAIEFHRASMETTTLASACADVLISNCVINLHPDKDAVYREAFRVLKPGGRLAVSDILLTEPIEADLRQRFQSGWFGCMGGAIPEDDYWQTLRNAGFAEVQIVARHPLAGEELVEMSGCPGEAFATPAPDVDLDRVQGIVESVKFTAVKPALAASQGAGIVGARLEPPGTIDNADAIAAVPGIDVVLIGTNDLCAELGIPGQFAAPKVEDAYRKVIAACKKHGKHPGMGGVYDQALLDKYIGYGMRFILGGGDLGFLMAGAKARTEFLRNCKL